MVLLSALAKAQESAGGVHRGAAGPAEEAAVAASALRWPDVTAAGSGWRLPAPPAPGQKGAAMSSGAGTRAATAERPAHNQLGCPGSLPGRRSVCCSLQCSTLEAAATRRCPPSCWSCRPSAWAATGCRTSQPAEIQNLWSLECLCLGGNFMKEIPPELAKLPSVI